MKSRLMVCCAAVMLVLSLSGSASAQFAGGLAWQVGDIVVCFGNGMCNVLRNTNGTLTLLDQISDKPQTGLGVTTQGETLDAVIDNTLHLWVSDAGDGSDIVEYSIASINQLQILQPPLFQATAIPHIPVNVFHGNGHTVRGVSFDKHGNMFVGNDNDAPTESASIVELNQRGTAIGSFSLSPNVTTPAWLANTAYPITGSPNINQILDPNGHVQSVSAAGKSGPQIPPFNQFGGNTVDGLQWTNQGGWTMGTQYTANVSTVGDTNFHLWLATTTGTSGPSQPNFLANETGVGSGMVTDGLQWQNSGTLCIPAQEPCPSAWVQGTFYGAGNSILANDDFVWNAITGGTSGAAANRPAFENNEGGGTVLADNAVVWADQGGFKWQPNHTYAMPLGPSDPNGIVVDPIGDVQAVKTPGTSGVGPAGGPTAPGTWNETVGQTTIDNAVIWSDTGAGAGKACFENELNSLDLSTDGGSVYFTSGPGGIIQKVTGLSACNVVADFGPNVSLQGIRVIRPNALPATCSSPDQTTPVSCPTGESLLVVATGTQYVDEPCFACSDLPGDPNNHNPPDLTEFSAGDDYFDICTSPRFGPGGPLNSVGGTMPPPTDSCALLLDLTALALPGWAPNHAYNVGDEILDPLKHVQVVTVAGTSAPIYHPTFDDSSTGTTTLDNPNSALTWKDLGPAVIRYPVPNVNTLQALALDPFVSNCTGNSCSATPLPTASVGKFYMGDFATDRFYRLDFAAGGGGTSPFHANSNCNGCNIVSHVQSMAIYGARDAAQPVLAQLYGPTTTSNAEVFFLQNKLITTIYNTSAVRVAFPLTLWASLVDKNSAFADPGNPTGVPCQPTTLSGPNTVDTNDCIIWKFDVTLPNNGDFISTVFGAPVTTSPTPPTIDFNTHIFTDMAFDTTTLFGNFDPSDSRFSVHSLHEVTPAALPGNDTTGGNCSYGSPVPKCFQNGGNIQFKFTCADPNLAGAALGTLSPPPFLLIDQTFPNVPFQSPLECGRTSTCTFSATNGSENYTFDPVKDQWVFGWSVPPASIPNTTRYFTACTTQPSLTSFCESFISSPKCSANPQITSVSPKIGSTAGGTTITINGFDFASPGATVQIQGVTVPTISVTSTSITVQTPPHAAGTVNVTVTNPPGPPSGLNGTLVNGFTYQ